MSFQMTSFEEILNYFKLRNCWLNSKLCAKKETLIKICDRATKLDSLGNFNLYPYIFVLGSHFYYTALPRSNRRARKLCFSVISENYYTNCKHFVWLFG